MEDVFETLIETMQKNVDEAKSDSGMDDGKATDTTTQTTTNNESGSGMEPANKELVDIKEDQPQDSPQQAVVDYNTWLKDKSNGLFNDEQSFVQSLEKFKKIEELEKNQLPEDQFVKTLAKLRNEGASKEQITEFVKFNTEYDNLETLDAKEIRVAKMVLIDGYSRKVAESKVNKIFDGLDEDSDTYEQDKLELEEDLRIQSKKDLEALKEYNAKISTIDTAKQKEQQELENKAIYTVHLDNVKQAIPHIKENFKSVSELHLKDTVNGIDVESKFNIEYDDDFKKVVPELLEKFLSDEIAPITQDRIKDAKEYIDALYLKENIHKIAEANFKNGIAKGLELADSKYENKSGLKPDIAEREIVQTNESKQWSEFEEQFGRSVRGF